LSLDIFSSREASCEQVPFYIFELEDSNLLGSSPTEALWIWETDGQELYFDKNEAVRIRVEAEMFNDLVPLAPNERQEQGVMDRKSPYEIQASMIQGGLGPCIWWDEE
jgi:DNA-directed RNA polymerase III subunit RPC8